MKSTKNTTFLKKYNELDVLCREKYDMFRDSRGERETLSAIREYADSLPDAYGELLINIIKLRNIIAHTDLAEASNDAIKDLDSFIFMVKKNKTPKDKEEFDLANYVQSCEKRIRSKTEEVIEDLDEDSHGVISLVRKNLSEYVFKIKKARSIDDAKTIMKDFYYFAEHPEHLDGVYEEALKSLKRETIKDAKEEYNDFLNYDPKNKAKRKAKALYQSFLERVEEAESEEELDEISDWFNESLNELED